MDDPEQTNASVANDISKLGEGFRKSAELIATLLDDSDLSQKEAAALVAFQELDEETRKIAQISYKNMHLDSLTPNSTLMRQAKAWEKIKTDFADRVKEARRAVEEEGVSAEAFLRRLES